MLFNYVHTYISHFFHTSHTHTGCERIFSTGRRERIYLRQFSGSNLGEDKYVVNKGLSVGEGGGGVLFKSLEIPVPARFLG